jgi:hypothetical protein
MVDGATVHLCEDQPQCLCWPRGAGTCELERILVDEIETK